MDPALSWWHQASPDHWVSHLWSGPGAHRRNKYSSSCRTHLCLGLQEQAIWSTGQQKSKHTRPSFILYPSAGMPAALVDSTVHLREEYSRILLSIYSHNKCGIFDSQGWLALLEALVRFYTASLSFWDSLCLTLCVCGTAGGNLSLEEQGSLCGQVTRGSHAQLSHRYTSLYLPGPPPLPLPSYKSALTAFECLTWHVRV